MKKHFIASIFILFGFTMGYSQSKGVNHKILLEKVDSIYEDILILVENQTLQLNEVYQYAFIKNAYTFTPQNIRHFKQLEFHPDSTFSEVYQNFLNEVYDTLIQIKSNKVFDKFGKKERDVVMFRIKYIGDCTIENDIYKAKGDSMKLKMDACNMKLNFDKQYISLLKSIENKSNLAEYFNIKNGKRNWLNMAKGHSVYFDLLKEMIFGEYYRYGLEEVIKTNRYLKTLTYFINENNIAKIKEKFPQYLNFKNEVKKYEIEESKDHVFTGNFNYYKLKDGTIKLKAKVNDRNKNGAEIGTIEIILAGYELKPKILSFRYIESKQLESKSITKKPNNPAISNYPVPPPPPPLPPGYKPKPMDW